MKNLIFLFIALISCLQLSAQSSFLMSSIPGPKLDSLHSDVVGEDYRLLITLPFGFNPSKRKYPVLFYLDALVSSGMMNELAQAKMFSRSLDPIILVGISYETNPMFYGKIRERDYMPPMNEADSKKGGDEFLQFIKTELIPYMEKNYGTDPNDRGLMGYSIGGLFTTWALKEEPALFQKLAIISPSLWYGEEYLFDDEALIDNIKNANDLKMFITCGSLESKNMISNTNRLFDLVQDNKNIQSTKVIFEDESHGSVSTTAMARGLYYLYGNEYKALIKQAKAYYKKQYFEKSLEHFEMAFEASPKQVDEDDRYDIACLYALTGEVDKAFEHLQNIANSNFDDYAHLVTDVDFNVLHKDKRWKDLLRIVKQNEEMTSKN